MGSFSDRVADLFLFGFKKAPKWFDDPQNYRQDKVTGESVPRNPKAYPGIPPGMGQPRFARPRPSSCENPFAAGASPMSSKGFMPGQNRHPGGGSSRHQSSQGFMPGHSHHSGGGFSRHQSQSRRPGNGSQVGGLRGAGDQGIPATHASSHVSRHDWAQQGQGQADDGIDGRTPSRGRSARAPGGSRRSQGGPPAGGMNGPGQGHRGPGQPPGGMNVPQYGGGQGGSRSNSHTKYQSMYEEEPI
ncbi:hypothetical protein ACLMJK_001911 [Lecanora helva]